MNDRLTFRFFNTKANKYMPAQYVDETTVFLLARLGGDKYIIEQCTGLKDKNGKLIYEGDIVKRHSKYDEEEKDIMLQVEWNYKGGRYITTDKKHGTWFFSMFDYEYEIVGNIHENPELLEDK